MTTMLVAAIAVLGLSSPIPTDAAPLRNVDDALARIIAVLDRPARTPAQHEHNVTVALTMLDQFERDHPEPEHRATAALIRAQCHLGLEDYPRALAEIDTALALPLGQVHAPVARYLRGRILIFMNEHEEGIATIRHMLRDSPNHDIAPEARLTLAQALADGGQGKAAAALLDTVVRAGRPTWAVQAAQMMIPAFRMIGERAPDFDTEALDGGRISLGLYRGRVVLLDFWATWCAPCRVTMPDVIRLYHRYHSRGFDVIGISLDHSPESLRDYVSRQGIPWRHVFDGLGWNSSLAKLYEVTGIPKTFLVDKDGRVSAIDLRGERLEAAVQRLLARP